MDDVEFHAKGYYDHRHFSVGLQMRIIQFLFVPLLFCACTSVHSAIFNINTPAYISCTTDETVELIKIGEYEGDNQADKLRAVFFKWVFDKVEKELRAQIDFIWKPKTPTGPQIEILTQDETYHTFVAVRSKTKNSAVVVSSASQINTVISWLFTFNFNLKTMLASRVQSGVANVRGEVMTFDCAFENLVGSGEGEALVPIETNMNLGNTQPAVDPSE